MGTISKHFSYHEFEKSRTAKARGIINSIPTAGVRDAVRELTLTFCSPSATPGEGRCT